jgi:hypothetical protein
LLFDNSINLGQGLEYAPKFMALTSAIDLETAERAKTWEVIVEIFGRGNKPISSPLSRLLWTKDASRR